MPERPLVLLSFDVEEFDVPLEYGRPVDEETQFELSSRGLTRVLDVLDSFNARATFFTTAIFAERRPELMRRVAQKHEVASHGYFHSAFEREHLRASRETLERVCRVPCIGFRRARMAPTDPAWIADAGYSYNSSENPTFIPGRYNNLSAPRRPYYAGKLLQIPVSVTPRVRFPLFWLTFKNLPLFINRAGASRAMKVDGDVNLYFHPWEFEDIRGWGLPFYISRHSGDAMLDRLAKHVKWLATQGEFGTFAQFAERYRQSHPK